MKRSVLFGGIVLSLLVLMFLLSPSPVRSQQGPSPTPQAEPAEEEPDPRNFANRFFDPRLIGPGWLESQGGLDGLSPRLPEGPPLNALKVVAGFNHACALTDAGGVRCWGDNYLGQLGDGTRTFRTTPVDVVGLDSNIVDISSSHNHTCALTDSGAVKCWGYNQHGELGDGSTINSLVPVDVYGLQGGVIVISAGGFHTCALMWNGAVKCWGANWHGEVGDGSTHDRYLPVDVVDLDSGVIGLATGKFHSCAILQNRNVKCWGYNHFGQQGNGSTADNHVPKKAIALGAGVLSIYAGGLHTCALTMDDKVKCWGDNSEGQLGVGPAIDKSTVPVKVASLDDIVVGMSLGGFHSCADIIDGGLKCWGDNWAGQLGNNTNVDSPWPTDVVFLSEPISSVAGGDSHTCAATSTGKALCWGSNNIGQLGNASSALSLAPVNVALSASVSDGAGGAGYACVLTAAGGVECWGNNKYGQLGDGTTIDRLTPVNVAGLTSGVKKVSTGALHSCAVLISGGVKCWGENVDGQLGDGTTISSSVPVDVYGLASGVADVEAGASHTCVLTTSGGVKCWGKNSRGRLGDGTNIDRLTPVDVLGQTSGVVDLEVGQHHSCILTQSGSVRCWGGNYSGQLGDGTDIDRWTSVAVVGLGSGVVGMTAGDAHTCALFNNGEASCWGANYSGELGDGTFNTHYVPGPVIGLPEAATVLEAGSFHTCAILSGGSVYCWGDNWNGQLGDESTVERPYPVAVSSLQSGVSDLFAGGRFTCGRMDDASLKCWGAGGAGQLGDGVPPWEPAPISVIGLTPASVAINYEAGQVGSYFHISGEDFLPGTDVQVTLNGYTFGQTILVNPDGSFHLVFSTAQAGEGDYFAYFESILRAMTIFHLNPNAPLRPLEGSGPILDVPSGIGLGIRSYFPMGNQ